MKTFVLGSFIALTSTVSFACEQAPAAAYHLEKINVALKSSAFDEEIQNHYDSSFEAGVRMIDIKDGEVRVRMSNKCDILIKVTYWSDNGGMCPQVDKITARTTCQKN